MILTRTVAPAAEPLTTAEAKSHIRVDTSDDDTLIDNLVKGAREYLEEATGRAFINQTWRLSLDAWPAKDNILLPRPPLSSVTSLTYYDQDATSTVWAATNYIVDTDSEPGRIVLAYNKTWPSGTLLPARGIEIVFVAGYGTAGSNMPQNLRQAILLLVGHWYENREAQISGTIPRNLRFALDALVWSNKVYI